MDNILTELANVFLQVNGALTLVFALLYSALNLQTADLDYYNRKKSDG